MSEPLTEAGRAFHAALHEPGGAYEQVTGRAECASLGCGSLALILDTEAESRASTLAEVRERVEGLGDVDSRAGGQFYRCDDGGHDYDCPLKFVLAILDELANR